MRPRSPGAVLAPGYEVVAHLARSNVLDVYHVWSEARNCHCVAKVLKPDHRRSTSARRRLLAEGALLESCVHPGIVRGYETVRSPEPVVVMETLGGETVAHLIERRELKAAELAFLGLQLASAAGYLHDRGIVHLDLKPSNVIADRGRAKVIDLSLARAPGRIKAGVGTWCYMAPEQARAGEVGPPADVWGIGIVLFSAVAGDTPFGDSDEEYPQLHMRAPAVSTERKRLPRALSAAIDACLEPDPASRPTLAQLRTRLEPVAGARG